MIDIKFIDKVIMELQENIETIKKYSFINKFIPVDSRDWSINHQFLGNLIFNNIEGLDPRQIEIKVRNIIKLVNQKKFVSFSLVNDSVKNKKESKYFTQSNKILKSNKDFIDFMDQPLIGPWS